ncbi:hypothetical protein LCGC14_0399300 [marine sediment metagenome]|uniref:Uncharacterized protein n=1 Tax=marine sediment metagenome TaxID=412755 RepID=A0A0F9T335_9ZZZZ
MPTMLKEVLKYSKGQKGLYKNWRAQKMLQSYDKDLVVRWLYDKHRWSIWTKDRKGKEYLICVVENLDGSYRNIDRRDLISLIRADLYRRTRADTLLKEIETHNATLEESKRKKLSDDVRAISRERWRYTFGHPVVNVPFNLKG